MQDYDKWNEIKKKIESLDKDINIKEANVYLLSIGKNIGNESYGKGDIFLRPVLVLKKLGHNYFIGIPMTSKKKVGSYFFEFSYAMFNQVKTINSKRILKYHGKLKQEEFKKLKDKFVKFLY